MKIAATIRYFSVISYAPMIGRLSAYRLSASADVRHIMAKVANTPTYSSASSQRCSHFPKISVTRSPHRRHRSTPIAANEDRSRKQSHQFLFIAWLLLGSLERRLEDVAGLLVALALHLLHPLLPERLAGNLVPAGGFRRRHVIAIELIIARLDPLHDAAFGAVEEVLAPELGAFKPALAHEDVAHILGEALNLLPVGA